MKITEPGPILSAKHLSKSFGSGQLRSLALNDVSLDIFRGKVTMLMGPSGSGKSTLLSILSGLLHPDAGQVMIHGTDLWQLSEINRERVRREHFGFIFQGFNLFPSLTARQQLEIVGDWSARKAGLLAKLLFWQPTKFRSPMQLLEQVGLKAKAHLRPHQLSGGEKQRVAIARALVKTPTVLFADEPTASLDWKHGQLVMEMMLQTAKESNTAVVLVTHDPRVKRYADVVYHLEDGALVESGHKHEEAPVLVGAMESAVAL